MNQKNKLQGNKLHVITSFLGICASVACACICVLLLSGDYHLAQFKMDTYSRELEGWEACRRTNIDYYKANEQAVNSCLMNLGQARDNFWVKLPKAKLAGIFVIATLMSASVGYLVTWIIVWSVGFSIHKFVRFFVFFLKFDANKPSHNKYNLHSFTAKPQRSHA
jgi:uncharacterized membrane protein YjdF